MNSNKESLQPPYGSRPFVNHILGVRELTRPIIIDSNETALQIKEGIAFVVIRNKWILDQYKLEGSRAILEEIPISRGRLTPLKRDVYERFVGIYALFQKYINESQVTKN